MRHFVPHFTSKTSAPRPFEGRGRGWGEQLQVIVKNDMEQKKSAIGALYLFRGCRVRIYN